MCFCLLVLFYAATKYEYFSRYFKIKISQRQEKYNINNILWKYIGSIWYDSDRKLFSNKFKTAYGINVINNVKTQKGKKKEERDKM